MRPLLAILFLLLVTPVHAQGFGQSLPFLAKDVAAASGDIPTQIGGIMHRWVASDLATNSSFTLWPDRIQQFNLQAVASAGQITNTSNAVWIQGSSFGGGGPYLVSTNWAYHGASNSLMLIFKRVKANERAAIFDKAGEGYLVLEPDGLFYINGGTRISSLIKTNVFQDLIIAYTNSGSNLAHFTNGVNSTLLAPPNRPGGNTFQNVGSSANGFLSFGGYIAELILWTNAVFTTAQISNLHYYATNTYGGSP